MDAILRCDINFSHNTQLTGYWGLDRSNRPVPEREIAVVYIVQHIDEDQCSSR